MDTILPTELTNIGPENRNYDILGFLPKGKNKVTGKNMVRRAKKMSAHLGEDDGQYLLDHQDEIPTILQYKMFFVFTDWRNPYDSGEVACVRWHKKRWILVWIWLDDDYWDDFDRVLRRK